MRTSYKNCSWEKETREDNGKIAIPDGGVEIHAKTMTLSEGIEKHLRRTHLPVTIHSPCLRQRRNHKLRKHTHTHTNMHTTISTVTLIIIGSKQECSCDSYRLSLGKL